MNISRFAFVLIIAILNGCALSPGMHYAKRSTPGEVDTSGTFQGLRVHLRSLTPQVAAQAAELGSLPLTIPAQLAEVRQEPYRLGTHDVVTVAVWDHPELTLPLGQYRTDLASGQMVEVSGKLFYPYAGLVQARGLTPPELREKLLGSLATVLNNPQLDVKITAFRSQKVFVHGAVQRPSLVPLTDLPITLLDAINQAGGVVPTGDASRVELTRGDSSWVIDLFARYAGTSTPASLILKDGDVIRVASREETKVYVMGEVERPSAVSFENGRLSLVQALSAAGGLSRMTAQSRGIYVIRTSGQGSVDVYHLDARNPLALALSDRFPLRPRDMIFVDATNLARWNRVVELVLPTTSLYNSTLQGVIGTKALIDD
jgi:polysaccharide export outer membrane protein